MVRQTGKGWGKRHARGTEATLLVKDRGRRESRGSGPGGQRGSERMVAMGRPPIIGAHNGNIQMGGQMSAGTFKELYFSPQGRISRSTFWLRFALPVFVISMVLSVKIGRAHV